MNTRLLLLSFLATAGLLVCSIQAQIVIVNPSVKASDISKGELKDVFTGSASSLKDGSHVSPVILKAGATEDQFLAAYVGKGEAAFRASWRSLVFSGEASMPKQFDSDAAMVEYVAHNPGAIGYIAKGSPHDGVKVLAVR
jgi:ABC-type phosphate transport system substrate-binding protein